MKYQIIDWTGKICFGGVLFDSFEDAWGFIYEKDPIPEPTEDNEAHYYDDYQVIEVD